MTTDGQQQLPQENVQPGTPQDLSGLQPGSEGNQTVPTTDGEYGQDSQGYINSTYQWGSPPDTQDSVPTEDEGGSYSGDMPDAELVALSEKLGINPDDLGRSEEDIKKDQPPMPTEDWYAQQFAEPEAKQFADNFRKHLGIDIKEVYELIHNTANVTKGLESWRQQVQAQRDLDVLRSELGNEFDNIMPQVAQEFQRIRQVNPQQAAALDNLDGARYLAAYIRQKSGGGRTTQPIGQNNQNVPQFSYPNVRQVPGSGGSKPPTIRMSEFLKWEDSEVQRRYNDIVQAKQNGTFIYDI